MVKPSPTLCARLRLTTKQVNGGYYKGTRSGSMGSHTGHGAYVIDYRKVRHFNCPDLTDFKLTPFVTRQMEPTDRKQTRPDGTTFTPKAVDGLEMLRRWRNENRDEFEYAFRLAHGELGDADGANEAENAEATTARKETIMERPQESAQSQPDLMRTAQ